MEAKINWGIIGVGGIARKFAEGVRGSQTGQLLACASRTQEKADAFGKDFAVPRCYGGYEAILSDADVRAVYIPLPNHLHAQWAIRAARAGKAVLCEKPLTVNAAEAEALRKAIEPTGVFFMEAFMYRCLPQTARLVELLRQNPIGDIRFIQAQFSYNLGPRYENIRLSNTAAGGGIMDVGCYCVSVARLVAGIAQAKPFAEPLKLHAVGHIGPVSRVDEWSAATLLFPGDITATLLCGTQVSVDNTLRIWGSAGNIAVPAPWTGSYGPGESKIILSRAGQKPEETIVKADRQLYGIEADTVAAHIDKPEAAWPAMTWDDSVANMRVLDQWRASIGLVFDGER